MFGFRKRKSFSESRERLPDAEFLGSVGMATGEKARYGVAIRRVMGRLCKVSPKLIRGSDGMKALCDLMFDGWDQLDFVFELESQLDIELNVKEIPHPDIAWKLFVWGQDRDERFGDFARRVVAYIDQKMSGSGHEYDSFDNLDG